MKKKYILSIDQGTTGTRAFLFDSRGRIVSAAYKEFRQYFPKSGWVEHDPEEIWGSCVRVIKKAVSLSGISPKNILSIGITNQRETTLLWDRFSSEPLGRAIVWQCRRTSDICKRLKRRNLETLIRQKTGLLLDPYFSGTKVKWMLDHQKGLKQKAAGGGVCFGTIDSWLIWKLTKGQAHVTDLTNASRTLFLNIKNRTWDNDLLKIFHVPRSILPQIQLSGSIFGHTQSKETGLVDGTPITAVMGDQQAALYGQGCYEPGSVKNTYGTGCFLVLNTGNKLYHSNKGLLSTIACDVSGKPVYALEGSIFIAGALIQWLRDELRIIKSSSAVEVLARKVDDTGGVYIVPAFTGLGAPYWKSAARGLITGITRGTGSGHLARASLEAIAYQTKDVFDLMKKTSGRRIKELKVDGGACQNNLLMKFQADMLGCRIIRPPIIDSTAKGAAYLSGVVMGLWRGKKDLLALQGKGRVFYPAMRPAERTKRYRGWLEAIRRTMLE